MGRRVDVGGQRFGRLTVIGRAPVDTTDRRHLKWLCRCDCGNTTKVTSTALRRGNTRSCGCLDREQRAARARERNLKNNPLRATHKHAVGGKPSRTYLSWQAMKLRCYSPSQKSYKNYGGRGITICDRWLNSFENFLADMGERPPGKTLDRYPDPDGNYEPGNCRWASPTEQAANKRKHSRR